ncbi:hypothetical protein MRX96_001253 [Rhipicephalus microplus]
MFIYLCYTRSAIKEGATSLEHRLYFRLRISIKVSNLLARYHELFPLHSGWRWGIFHLPKIMVLIEDDPNMTDSCIVRSNVVDVDTFHLSLRCFYAVRMFVLTSNHCEWA